MRADDREVAGEGQRRAEAVAVGGHVGAEEDAPRIAKEADGFNGRGHGRAFAPPGTGRP